MNNNILYDKALSFSIRIVNLFKYLNKNGEHIMSKQLLRSGTSIGANVSESVSAESTSDFIHKLAISQKETDETLYWLTLLHATDYLSDLEYASITDDCIEIRKLPVSIATTLKKRNNS